MKSTNNTPQLQLSLAEQCVQVVNDIVSVVFDTEADYGDIYDEYEDFDCSSMSWTKHVSA